MFMGNVFPDLGRRGWDLNPLARLKTRKLLKTLNAKNAKSGQNAELGYAEVTHPGSRNSPRYQKHFSRILSRQRGWLTIRGFPARAHEKRLHPRGRLQLRAEKLANFPDPGEVLDGRAEQTKSQAVQQETGKSLGPRMCVRHDVLNIADN
jgi:hypothetical protein